MIETGKEYIIIYSILMFGANIKMSVNLVFVNTP